MDANVKRVWPTTPAGQKYVTQSLRGGEYISTGYFPSEKVDRHGRGRTTANCTAVTSLFFDVDLLGLYDAAREARGQVIELRAAERKAKLYSEDPEVVAGLRLLLLEEVVPCVERAIGSEPTLTLDSGWGFHIHYAVAEDMGGELLALQQIGAAIIDEANRLAFEVGRSFAPSLKMASAFDATHDVGVRLARLPGSMNTKAPGNEREVRVVQASPTVLERGVLAELRAAYLRPGVLPDDGQDDQAVPKPRRPKDATKVEVDFRVMRLSDGRVWQTVADALSPGERTKVVCPFGGSTIGSGFFSREPDGRSRYYSAPQACTYWNTYTTTSRSGLANLVQGPGRNGRPAGPLNSPTNLRTMLEDDNTWDLWFDAFRECEMNGDKPLHDIVWVEVLQHMDRAYGWAWRPGRELIWSTLEQVCRERSRNPVQDYLRSLTWDGVPRCHRWLADVCGLDDRDVFRAYSLRWCIGFAARTMQPGCKLDTCLVLTGPQGYGKSTLFREWATLPGLGTLFSDTRFNLRDKDAYLQLYQALVYESAEMSSFSTADKEMLKAFLSSDTDRIRPPFGRKVRTFRRHTIIVGTSNERNLLRDNSGDRRYWVVEVPRAGVADLEWLRNNKAQMYAEAVARFAAGEQWWLTEEEDELRKQNNEKFRFVDWYTECAITVYAHNDKGPRNRVTVASFAAAIDDHINPQSRGLSLSAALLRAGFEKIRSNGTTWYERPGVCTGDSSGLSSIRKLQADKHPHLIQAHNPGD